jgi:DNA-binding IclR family transcriptional regulator
LRSRIQVIDQVLHALDGEFRSTAEIAERCGLAPSRVSACLGHLRRRGDVEYMVAKPGHRSMWRRARAPSRALESVERLAKEAEELLEELRRVRGRGNAAENASHGDSPHSFALLG